MGLSTVPEGLSSDPLEFCRDMLSEVSLPGHKHRII